ncbi:uncharacterized protein, partial [Argopecten irradians]|uniref:uncharacterized protein n=1 Tax=Argopecten irradians TaxID=31199 RepID=UPI00371F7D79
LKEEAEKLRKDEDRKEKEREVKAKEVRKRAMECLRPSKVLVPEIPTPRKKKDQGVIEYLREKAEGERDMKKEELEIRKEEVKLQRERFELEKEERSQRLAIEKEEKNLMFELLRKCLSK